MRAISTESTAPTRTMTNAIPRFHPPTMKARAPLSAADTPSAIRDATLTRSHVTTRLVASATTDPTAAGPRTSAMTPTATSSLTSESAIRPISTAPTWCTENVIATHRRCMTAALADCEPVSCTPVRATMTPKTARRPFFSPVTDCATRTEPR